MILRILLALALLPAAATAQSLAGTYTHQSPEGPVTLTLQEQGSVLVGSMTGVDGAVFQLEGTIESGRATGMIRIGDGTGWFATGPVGEGLILVVAELDGAGQPDLTQAWNLEFARTDARAQAPSAGGPMTNPGQPQPGTAEPAVERDPALVGLWSHSDTYRSGDFFATTRLNMQVNPDGTYLYGGGNLSLGGNYSGQSDAGNVTRGKWRTEGGVVYVMADGSPQWVPHARYYVEDASLMFTFGDGKRQLWHRR